MMAVITPWMFVVAVVLVWLTTKIWQWWTKVIPAVAGPIYGPLLCDENSWTDLPIFKTIKLKKANSLTELNRTFPNLI